MMKAMNESEFRFEANGRGALVIDDKDGRVAEMNFEKQGLIFSFI